MESPEHSSSCVDEDVEAPLKANEEDPPPRKGSSKEKGRKRTKTGCLSKYNPAESCIVEQRSTDSLFLFIACRKRRIKCGEERPTCYNCNKSKRQCEGYTQRILFKSPLNSYRPSLSSSTHTSQSGNNQNQTSARRGASFQDAAPAQSAAPIAPKRTGSFGPSLTTLNTGRTPSVPPASSPGVENRQFAFQTCIIPSTVTNSRRPAPSIDNRSDTVDRSHVPEPRRNIARPERVTHYDFNALVRQESPIDLRRGSMQSSPQDWSAGASSASSYTPNSERQFPPPAAFFGTFPATAERGPARTASSNSSNPRHSQSPVTTVSPQVRPEPQGPASLEGRAGYDALPTPTYEGASLHQVRSSSNSNNGHPGALPYQHNQIIDDDDDPFDVTDDEDMLMEEYSSAGDWQGNSQNDHLRSNDLGLMVAHRAGHQTHDTNPRSFTSSMDHQNMLATYTPSPQSSPLNDSKMAAVFCHFVNVTGPCISMFERHPANSSLIFQGRPILQSQQHIWTYTFPTLALSNPALLHAMLALACLHIAKLQNRPITASLKHYAIGLRRVAKCVSLPSKRGQPATLAAALLLAFYECWSADHQKWSNHVLGARQLVREIDFSGMTRYIKSKKIQKRQEERMRYYHQAQQQGMGHNFYDDRVQFQAYVDDVDENIVGMIMGKEVAYDTYGSVIDDGANGQDTRAYSEKDLEIYETQRDLFWWYCKQDAYQSILGGGRLFMEYGLWSHCPPRAPLGRLNAIYGTFDHVILLMGRLADFASKDLKRKRLAMKANGGWRPPVDPNQPGPSQVHQGPPPQHPQMPRGPPQMPSFSGMVPDVHEAQLPMGFEHPRNDSPKSTDSSDLDLEQQRLEAEEEWHDIHNAFQILRDHFGEDFQPLGPDFQAPIQTPFGTALQYRTYGIAGVWMNYYMALIACYRAHPSMPPAATMAAGIAARQTAFFANELGRIAAGISPDCNLAAEVNPGVGAAIMESSTLPIPHQRAWTITRLRDIARLTGWQTALAIATGCETFWVKAAELGKGPPYTRTREERITPDIWNSGKRVHRIEWDNRGKEGGREIGGGMGEGNGGMGREGRLVVSGSDRVHYALGVLGLEEDFERLDLDNDAT
ncbi:hypothetical protein B0J14DRAFT_661984 [Halenospora varia]|nr:hypothetical protein B0J14DRAFT_661984 [Halenospora varia]